jgi:hypothetical protein
MTALVSIPFTQDGAEYLWMMPFSIQLKKIWD